MRATAMSVRGDLWLFNHLAGGPILEALEVHGHNESAKRFGACKHNSDKRRERCYNASVAERSVTLRPWSHYLKAVTTHRRQAAGAGSHGDIGATHGRCHI